jgi:hypothetical protein
MEGKDIPTHTAVYQGVPATLGKERKAAAQPPARARLHGVNHAAV